jgi:GTPase SAR1 family protein
VVLVYDITNRESFTNVGKWLDETKAYANDKVTSFLVANKTDLEGK